MSAGLFFGAVALALGLGGALARRQIRRPSPSRAWWMASMLGYAVAFTAEAVTVGPGQWTVGWYRAYLVASAELVATMAVGCAYLAWRAPVARGFAIGMATLTAALLAWVVRAPLRVAGPWLAVDAGQHILQGWGALLYGVTAGVGGAVVVVSCFWSAWRRRALGPAVIGAGALLSSAAGSLASQGLGLWVFPLVNLIALVLIFLGYEWSLVVRRPQVGVSA
ncbi:MAG: hypothetical protein K6U14_08920 [Firmicutes bacterium]|nr:hypothetical protein [Alicyclobacillaceae bacterium]MCL6497732.1 hypothetical protein [Bacillota bacterium]